MNKDGGEAIRLSRGDLALLRRAIVALVHPDLLTQLKELAENVATLERENRDLRTARAEAGGGRQEAAPTHGHGKVGSGARIGAPGTR